MAKLNLKNVLIILSHLGLLISSANNVVAQVDSIRFFDGQILAGEIKSMKEGVLEVETEFSDSDFKIEWEKVSWLRTETKFFITLKKEDIFYSYINSINDSLVQIVTRKNDSIYVDLHDIVYLDALDEKFGDRLDAELSIGFDLAKASNLRSLSLRSYFGYKTEKWSTDLAANTLSSQQDESDLIKRLDAEFNYRWIIFRRWYLIGTLNALSNTEQYIDLRLNSQLGVGLYLLRSNKAHWGIKGGANYNTENYSNELFIRSSLNRSTWEGFAGTELNIYDLGDFSLKLMAISYSGITDPGRFRSDINLDLKYDLPLDFFIKLGASLNYDNRPVLNSDKADYVLQSTFGWEW
ncbi:DUF481 domain-containing protein [Maribellus mangrovi]|uniref:DUF481 domain-containing protein n=1 Tax=Maribellus mangrovi TaxID=3133146 RepID=UPI0030EB7A0E